MPIEPDTKDWTWVLQRPCPECRADASAAARGQVPSEVRRNAAGWLRVLAGPVRERPAPDAWSPLEYACHVRDVLRLYDTRLLLMLERDDPLYANWDQDEAAVADRYGEQDPAVVSAELAVAAETIAARFETLDDEQWLRTGPT